MCLIACVSVSFQDWYVNLKLASGFAGTTASCWFSAFIAFSPRPVADGPATDRNSTFGPTSALRSLKSSSIGPIWLARDRAVLAELRQFQGPCEAGKLRTYLPDADVPEPLGPIHATELSGAVGHVRPTPRIREQFFGGIAQLLGRHRPAQRDRLTAGIRRRT